MTNNRWFQLCASLIAMIMIANLQYAWTLFVEPMRTENGWPLQGIQNAFALFILFQTWVQPLDGWLIDRLGPRWFISAAGVLCGVGWAGMGMVSDLTALKVLYVTAGVGAAFVYSGSIGSALKWFKDRRGLASGIMAAGFGAGTALFIPWISWMIAGRGYRDAFLWTGVLQGVVILIAAQFLRHPPAAAAPAAPKAPVAERVGRHQFTTAEMLRAPQFYVLYTAFVLMAIGGLLVTANAGPISRSWGFPQAVLTAALTLSPLANGASRIFWGFVSDRLGRELTMIVAFVLQAVSLVLLMTLGSRSGAWFQITLVLTFFTWGEIFSLFPSISGDYFGTKHATSNYAVLYTAKGVAAIFGVSVATALYGQFNTWSAVLLGSAGLALVSATIAFGLYRVKRAQLVSAPDRAAVV
jgi:OFA family oxalate/formate antiporter-like MFS transporter